MRTWITWPFSACTQIMAPYLPARRMALNRAPSSSMRTPGYAMNNLKLVTPSRAIRVCMSASDWSLTSSMIIWAPTSTQALAARLCQSSKPTRGLWPAGLVAKIDDRRRPPKRRRLRPRAKRVHGARHAKVPVQVGMHINTAGQDEETAGIMRLHVLAGDQPLANGMNPAILDEQVGLIIVHSRDNASVLDQDCCHRLLPRIGCRTIVSPVCDTLPLLTMPAQVGLSHTGLCSSRISYDRRAWLLPSPFVKGGNEPAALKTA